jgi:hypothetical protein
MGPVAVEVQLLLVDGDDDLQRSGGILPKGPRLTCSVGFCFTVAERAVLSERSASRLFP